MTTRHNSLLPFIKPREKEAHLLMIGTGQSMAIRSNECLAGSPISKMYSTPTAGADQSTIKSLLVTPSLHCPRVMKKTILALLVQVIRGRLPAMILFQLKCPVASIRMKSRTTSSQLLRTMQEMSLSTPHPIETRKASDSQQQRSRTSRALSRTQQGETAMGMLTIS